MIGEMGDVCVCGSRYAVYLTVSVFLNRDGKYRIIDCVGIVYVIIYDTDFPFLL